MKSPCVETASINVLYFHIGETRFCINLSQTSRVLPLVALQPIPDAPDYVAGVMNLHGRSVPVVDLVYRLNLPYTRPYKVSACIILCQIEEKMIGLIADDVDQIGVVEPEMIQLHSLFNGDKPPLLGLVESTQGMSAWLALEPVLDFDFSQSDGHIASDYHEILNSFPDKIP
ncbi:MAG: hypothetical protein CO187_03190 [Zetaproteobacteria bacterium CG_4_9_14_3_um_filter_53_7]|nr:MAG: hypothetical protein CO187_03190 [Zetaproteobacteria bacterium CG_4_9_14_3_um_filter_53_7]